VGLTAFLNNTAGIAQPIPSGIAPLPGPFSSRYARTDIAYDYAIGGIPFISGESLRGSYYRKVYTRSFSPIRKDQFDNQQVPGEQSLWGWWLRSQSSFSQGGGSQFLDTTQDPLLGERFFYSEGVDMLSTPGQISLLQTTTANTGSTGPVQLRGANNGTEDGVLILDTGSTVFGALSFLGVSGTTTLYAFPGGLTGLANTFTDDGTNYYFADKTGIYKGAIATPGVAAAKIWNVPSTSGRYVIGWVKGRLVAGLDNNVYELVGAGPGLPAVKFAHQNTAYTYTGISEIGTAILVSGNAGGAVSQIHKFTLDGGGAMPVLTSGVVAAQMPYGEKILTIYAYIGAYVGIGTNKGFRVAVADSNGNLAYGPLIVQDPNNVGVRAIGGYDRFMFIGNQGNSLIPQVGWENPSDATDADFIMRVDLGSQTSTGGQPFANDLMGDLPTTGSPVNSIANMGSTSQVVFSTGGFVYSPNTSFKVSSGFFYTPKIRFNTLEPKHFKYVYLRHPNIDTGDGSIDIWGQNPTSGLELIVAGVQGSSADGAASPFYIPDIGDSQEWFQFKFVLNRNTNNSPVMNGYQLRGLPGVARQVIIEIPMLCFDRELDRYSNPAGYDGFAYERIKALEALTASGNIVLFQDLNYNDSNLVVVDDYRFEQQSPELSKAASNGGQDSNAHGGYVTLHCRVIV